jgi:hypothetical protein
MLRSLWVFFSLGNEQEKFKTRKIVKGLYYCFIIRNFIFVLLLAGNPILRLLSHIGPGRFTPLHLASCSSILGLVLLSVLYLFLSFFPFCLTSFIFSRILNLLYFLSPLFFFVHVFPFIFSSPCIYLFCYIKNVHGCRKIMFWKNARIFEKYMFTRF